MKARPARFEAAMTVKWLGIGVAAILAAGSAWAQTDPLAPGAANSIAAPEPGGASDAADKPAKASKPRPRPKARSNDAVGSLAVTVNNKRSVGLVDLTVSPAGDADTKKVAGPLAFGRKTVIHIKRTKDCLYDVRGHFADEADTEQLGVQLCKDKVINLTDD
jgi:hypothetical protein